MSDFAGGIAARRIPALRVVLLSYPVSFVLLAALAAAVGGAIPPGAIWWGAACGVALGVGGWWFYAALGSGPIAVVSPLSAVLTAAVPVGVGLTLGERPGLTASIGVVLALVSVVLVSREVTDEDIRPHRFTPRVAALTVGAGLAFGLNFVFLAQTPADSGLWPLMVARLVAAVVVFGVAAVAGELRLPTGRSGRLSVVAALLDVGGNVAMLFALRYSPLALASVLISLFPAVTVVLAIVVLRERTHRWQILGMGLAATSVAMIVAG